MAHMNLLTPPTVLPGPAAGSVEKTAGLLCAGLTTTEAPFIEEALAHGELFIEQPYRLYTEANHKAWRHLYARMIPRWERYGNEAFLRGIESLCLKPDRVPRLADVNQFLSPLTGFRATAVAGYVPAFYFFDCLRKREFPTTVTIRRADRLDYLPEPDIFHDIAGHVPMHTDPAFADTLVRFGECAHTGAEIARSIRDVHDRRETLKSIIRAMARFFWFTVEFGLMRSREGLRVYGSGLLSSFGEIQHALESPDVQRYPLQLEWAVNQGFAIDHYQPVLFVVEGFDHLYEMVGRLEQWMKKGKLNNVAPGEPLVADADIESFLDAA